MSSLVFSKQLRCVPTHSYRKRSAAPQGSSDCNCDQQAKPYDQPHMQPPAPPSLLFIFLLSAHSYHSICISQIWYLSVLTKWQGIIYFCCFALSNWLFYNLINAAECHRGFLSSSKKVSVSVLCKYHSNVVPPFCQIFYSGVSQSGLIFVHFYKETVMWIQFDSCSQKGKWVK